MSYFSDRVVLITGAGSGIGRQLALQLASEGAAIAALDCNSESLAKLAAELKGAKVAWAVGDVTDRPSVHAAVSSLRERLGPAAMLFACAGVGYETSAVPYRAEDIEKIIRVNLLGVSNSIDAVLPDMLEQKRGHIVGLSSLASFRGLPRMAGYCASKAGLNALLEALRVELRPVGIQVTTICPGWVRTPMTDGLAIPANELLPVERTARLIIEAVRRKQPLCAFPPTAVRRLRLLQWLPCSVADAIVARLLQRYSRG